MSEPEHNPAEPQTLPPPSAALILISSLTRAYLRRLPKGERRAFLRDVTDDLKWQAELAAVIRIRPSDQDATVAEARREASVWWMQVLGLIMTRLDR